MHVVELDNGRGGVRRVKAENSSLYVMETRSRRRPMPPIKDQAFSSCAWRRAVLRLDAPQQAWINYCYGYDLRYCYQIEICKYIWGKYEKELNGVKPQNRVKRHMVSLVWLAVQDLAAKNRNEFYKEYAATALAGFLSVHRDTWYQTYSKGWERLKVIVSELDCEALNIIFMSK